MKKWKLLKLREVRHKNTKIEFKPNSEVCKNFVFILKKDSINNLLICTFDWSWFKIDLNGRVSNQCMSFKKADIFRTDVNFAKSHPFNEKIGDFSETDDLFKDVFLKKSRRIMCK
jgi:hypothetical protein